MHRSFTTAILTVALAALGLSAPSAQSEQGLAHGQGVYHRADCPGPADTGTARCHAHVVTDKSNTPIESAGPNAAPAGFSPASLRTAYNLGTAGMGFTSFATAPVIAIVDAFGYASAEQDL